MNTVKAVSEHRGHKQLEPEKVMLLRPAAVA